MFKTLLALSVIALLSPGSEPDSPSAELPIESQSFDIGCFSEYLVCSQSCGLKGTSKQCIAECRDDYFECAAGN